MTRKYLIHLQSKGSATAHGDGLWKIELKIPVSFVTQNTSSFVLAIRALRRELRIFLKEVLQQRIKSIKTKAVQALKLVASPKRNETRGISHPKPPRSITVIPAQRYSGNSTHTQHTTRLQTYTSMPTFVHFDVPYGL
jgi:hypothetical protein